MPEQDDYADRKLRSAFTVKGLSRETMDAVEAGEIVIVGDDDPQTEMLKELGGQSS